MARAILGKCAASVKVLDLRPPSLIRELRSILSFPALTVVEMSRLYDRESVLHVARFEVSPGLTRITLEEIIEPIRVADVSGLLRVLGQRKGVTLAISGACLVDKEKFISLPGFECVALGRNVGFMSEEDLADEDNVGGEEEEEEEEDEDD